MKIDFRFRRMAVLDGVLKRLLDDSIETNGHVGGNECEISLSDNLYAHLPVLREIAA